MDQKYMMTLLDKKTNQLKTFDIRTGEVVSTDGVPTTKALFGYSLEIADAICNLVREGHTLTKIADMEHMPSLHVVYKWKNIHPDFKKRLEEARNDRADFYHDKAEACIEDVELKDDVPVGKFKFDSYMKLAEKGNPMQYGQRSTIGEAAGALQIIVNTGIVREEPITVEVNDVEDKNSGREQQFSVDRRSVEEGTTEGKRVPARAPERGAEDREEEKGQEEGI